MVFRQFYFTNLEKFMLFLLSGTQLYQGFSRVLDVSSFSKLDKTSTKEKNPSCFFVFSFIEVRPKWKSSSVDKWS